MGTNFYWTEGVPCSACGRAFESRHIGKSSAGWVFALHVYPDAGIHDLVDWLRRFVQPGSEIRDEYGKVRTVEEMVTCITARMKRGTGWGNISLAENHAMLGPFGLARALIDGAHCIGHGAGTWDLHAGDFS